MTGNVCWCRHAPRDHADVGCQRCYAGPGLLDWRHAFRAIASLPRLPFRVPEGVREVQRGEDAVLRLGPWR